MKPSWSVSWHQVLIGALIGFFIGASYTQWQSTGCVMPSWKKGHMKEYMVQKMNRELHLSAEQKTRIEEIFDGKKLKMMALREEMRPRFEALREETKMEIRQTLDPVQQTRFDEISLKMEEKWKKHRENWEARKE